MAFLNELKEKISVLILRICAWFRKGWDIVKTSGEKHSVEGEIHRRYEELGRTIYESKGEDMGACREICDKIDELTDRLEAIKRKDTVLYSRKRCPRCGEAVSKKAKFCSACGAAMPEEASQEQNPPTEE